MPPQSAITEDHDDAVRLLRSVAEQLTSPLTIISREAELALMLESKPGATAAARAKTIQVQAAAALTLVESYLLGLELLDGQTSLALEPVSVSSLLIDVAHELQGFANQYNVALRVAIAGRYEPVMAHRQGLQAALLALGYALLEAYPSPGKSKSLTLAVHRTPHGIVTGLYGEYEQLSSRHWRRALELQGRAPQAFSTLCKGSAAGLFVAQAILHAMATHLRVGRHQKMRGLATTLHPSQQLQFV